jgi:hypothetical protein
MCFIFVFVWYFFYQYVGLHEYEYFQQLLSLFSVRNHHLTFTRVLVKLSCFCPARASLNSRLDESDQADYEQCNFVPLLVSEGILLHDRYSRMVSVIAHAVAVVYCISFPRRNCIAAPINQRASALVGGGSVVHGHAFLILSHGRIFYRFLRPELVRDNPDALSSDVFSGTVFDVFDIAIPGGACETAVPVI